MKNLDKIKMFKDVCLYYMSISDVKEQDKIICNIDIISTCDITMEELSIWLIDSFPNYYIKNISINTIYTELIISDMKDEDYFAISAIFIGSLRVRYNLYKEDFENVYKRTKRNYNINKILNIC